VDGCAAPVISVELTDELGDDATAKSVIRSTDQSPTVIRCLVVGGFPPPTITVALDRRDVTAHFRFRSRANVTGSRGLRLIEYRSERWTSDCPVHWPRDSVRQGEDWSVETDHCPVHSEAAVRGGLVTGDLQGRTMDEEFGVWPVCLDWRLPAATLCLTCFVSNLEQLRLCEKNDTM